MKTEGVTSIELLLLLAIELILVTILCQLFSFSVFWNIVDINPILVAAEIALKQT